MRSCVYCIYISANQFNIMSSYVYKLIQTEISSSSLQPCFFFIAYVIYFCLFFCLFIVFFFFFSFTSFRHVMGDAGVVTLAMYRCTPHGIRCLSVIGWTFTILATYSGYICLLLGVLWGSGIFYRVNVLWRKATGSGRPSINCDA